MNRRNFMKSVGMGLLAISVPIGVVQSGTQKTFVIMSGTPNRSRELVSICAPYSNVLDSPSLDEQILEVEVLVNGKRERIEIDTAKEDILITFPDGSTWESSKRKAVNAIKIKE